MLEILYENFIYHGDVPCWGEKAKKNNKKKCYLLENYSS